MEFCTDNATTFTGDEMQIFFKESGIKHITGAPYHPSTNGLAENAVGIMENAILKARFENPTMDIDLIINRFLFYYRNTPHCSTGETPAKLLMGRSLRTKFDLLLPSVSNLVKEKQNKQIKYYNSSKQDIFFKKGDKVWIKDFRKDKFPWCPGNILEVLGRRTYIVKTDCGMTWKRHTDQLKPNFSVNSKVKDISIIPRSELAKDIENKLGFNDISHPEPGWSGAEVNLNNNTQSDRVLRRRSRLQQPDRLAIG